MSFSYFYHIKKRNFITLNLIYQKDLENFIKKNCDDFEKKILENYKKDLDVPSFINIFNKEGSLSQVIYFIDKNEKWPIGNLGQELNTGNYEIINYTDIDDERLFLGFALGQYSFNRYKKYKVKKAVKILLPKKLSYIEKYIKGHFLIRDLINTPAEDLNPETLGLIVKNMAKAFHAEYSEIVGKDLLKENYNGVYAVGKAAKQEPRLISLKWGSKNNHKIVLVGKGVCFDTGGLDLKLNKNMLLMLKDMGGAAQVIGLARMIMDFKLPIYLEVLIPAVENAINEKAYRPSDIITLKDKTTLQITNTDAEGRIVLADALYEAHLRAPKLIIDFATLTGSMRVALGPDLPGFFTNDKKIGRDLQDISEKSNDLIWQMPLYQNYFKDLKGNFSDLVNSPNLPFGGSIHAGLFLEHFVKKTPWIHIDLMAWNKSKQKGKPIGGEASGIYAIFNYIKANYCNN